MQSLILLGRRRIRTIGYFRRAGGGKLSQGETNAELQKNAHSKPQSGVALFLDFNARSGYFRGSNCRSFHEYPGGRNLH